MRISAPKSKPHGKAPCPPPVSPQPKVIQIQVSPTGRTNPYQELFALRDDGRIFVTHDDVSWQEITPPSDPVEEENPSKTADSCSADGSSATSTESWANPSKTDEESAPLPGLARSRF